MLRRFRSQENQTKTDFGRAIFTHDTKGFDSVESCPRLTDRTARNPIDLDPSPGLKFHSSFDSWSFTKSYNLAVRGACVPMFGVVREPIQDEDDEVFSESSVRVRNIDVRAGGQEREKCSVSQFKYRTLE